MSRMVSTVLPVNTCFAPLQWLSNFYSLFPLNYFPFSFNIRNRSSKQEALFWMRHMNVCETRNVYLYKRPLQKCNGQRGRQVCMGINIYTQIYITLNQTINLALTPSISQVLSACSFPNILIAPACFQLPPAWSLHSQYIPVASSTHLPFPVAPSSPQYGPCVTNECLS